MANVNVSKTSGGATSKGVVIHFGPRAKPHRFSGYSRTVLTSIMTEAEVHTVWITSTYRDASDQARAMVQNLESRADNGRGVKGQRALYGRKPGSGIIDLYERERAAVADAERRGIDTGLRSKFALQRHLLEVVERRISQIGPEKVSHHSGLQAILNVFDVDPASMRPHNGTAFLKAAHNDPRVTRLITPPDDLRFTSRLPSSATSC